MASNKTVVKGIRASQEFFDMCDLVAKCENIDRNKLIIKAVCDYVKKETKKIEKITNGCSLVKTEDENVKNQR